MESDVLAGVRMRAEAAGLNLDDERLGKLADLLVEFERMTASLEGIEVDPTDLALGLYDPAWQEEAAR